MVQYWSDIEIIMPGIIGPILGWHRNEKAEKKIFTMAENERPGRLNGQSARLWAEHGGNGEPLSCPPSERNLMADRTVSNSVRHLPPKLAQVNHTLQADHAKL